MGNVIQSADSITYSDQVLPGSTWRDAYPYNMPYKIGQGLLKYANWNSYSSATYDVNTGYALANIDFRTHTIFTHGYWGYFFEPI